MASLVLKVDWNVMDQKATELENKSKAMEQLIINMKSTVDSLTEAWQSDAGSNYIGKFGVAKTECEDSIVNLTKHINTLRQAAELYRTTEDNVSSSAVEPLSTNNIF